MSNTLYPRSVWNMWIAECEESLFAEYNGTRHECLVIVLVRAQHETTWGYVLAKVLGRDVTVTALRA